jgi:hypothetical protein
MPTTLTGWRTSGPRRLAVQESWVTTIPIAHPLSTVRWPPMTGRLSEGCLSLAAPASDLQSRRRRGIGRALVAARLADATERGATTVVSAPVPTVGGYGKHSNSTACRSSPHLLLPTNLTDSAARPEISGSPDPTNPGPGKRSSPALSRRAPQTKGFAARRR